MPILQSLGLSPERLPVISLVPWCEDKCLTLTKLAFSRGCADVMHQPVVGGSEMLLHRVATTMARLSSKAARSSVVSTISGPRPSWFDGSGPWDQPSCNRRRMTRTTTTSRRGGLSDRSQAQQHKQLTFLFADVVGFTTLCVQHPTMHGAIPLAGYPALKEVENRPIYFARPLCLSTELPADFKAAASIPPCGWDAA